MKIAVVGPGAMGCLFAALLTEAGHEVWLLGKSPGQTDRIARNGVRISGIGGCRTVRPNATADPRDLRGSAVFFLWVKAYDTASAIEAVAPVVDPYAQVVSLQNGLGNLETIARLVPPRQIVGGATAWGAMWLSTGSVRHTGTGDTVIGRMDDRADGELRRTADLLSAAGVQTGVSPRLESALWSKLIVNAAVNPLTAIARVKNGALLEIPELRGLLDRSTKESERIVAQAGIPLAYPDMVERVHAVCGATAANRSSMLQDVLRARRTEIDAINGALARRAASLHLQAPINETLAALVKTLEDPHYPRE